MGAIPYREGGSFLTQRLDQRRGQYHKASYTKIPVDRSRGAGHDPFAVQKLAGHSDVRLTTQTYAHVQEEVLKKAVSVLDRMDWKRETATILGNGSVS